jgi:hypothetical protein
MLPIKGEGGRDDARECRPSAIRSGRSARIAHVPDGWTPQDAIRTLDLPTGRPMLSFLSLATFVTMRQPSSRIAALMCTPFIAMS